MIEPIRLNKIETCPSERFSSTLCLTHRRRKYHRKFFPGQVCLSLQTFSVFTRSKILLQKLDRNSWKNWGEKLAHSKWCSKKPRLFRNLELTPIFLGSCLLDILGSAVNSPKKKDLLLVLREVENDPVHLRENISLKLTISHFND